MGRRAKKQPAAALTKAPAAKRRKASGLKIGRLRFRDVAAGRNRAEVEIVRGEGWSPCSWTQPRKLVMKNGSVEAKAGDEALFWLLFQLESSPVRISASLDVEMSPEVFAFDETELDEDARRGDLLARTQQYGPFKSLRRLLKTFATRDHGSFEVVDGLRGGGDDDDETLCGFLGASGRLEGVDFSVEAVLAAASSTEAVLDGPDLEMMKTPLHPFQKRGVRWMAEREDFFVPNESTHPAWAEYVTADGEVFYCHRHNNALSRRKFPAPQRPSGGLLCDDVGLGKSIQILGLVASRPPEDGWAVESLPSHTDDYVPIRTTLVVCPAVILSQWKTEIETHTDLEYCVYLGIGGGGKRGGGGGGARNSPRDLKKRVEVLARGTHLFDGKDVAKCDICLCSFEVLRDEVRKTGGAFEDDTLRLSTPLGALGFYRIVLDEAQLVSQATSVAALMCSSLVRRHAWVATATPIAKDASEIHGLLAFLAAHPLSEKYVCDQLYVEPFRRREKFAAARLVHLLKALMLRRTKEAVFDQIALPPLEWETATLRATAPERAAYRLAEDSLKKSYARYSRSAKNGLGPLNAALTRLRQTVCHPSVVNFDRDRAASSARVVLGDEGQALPLSQVLSRIVQRAQRDTLNAKLAHVRARLVALELGRRDDSTEAISRDYESLKTDKPLKDRKTEAKIARLAGSSTGFLDAMKLVASTETTLREKESSRAYLESEQEQHCCPICLETRENALSWSVAVCGHGACLECWMSWHHTCPVCKRALAKDAIFVSKGENDQTDDLDGDWGTKLSALLKEVGAADRAGEKVVVFSAWTRLLKLAGDACAAHSVPFASLVGSPKAKQLALRDFNNASSATTVLLVPLFGGASGAGGGGAAGLTLTAASTAILLEPALQSGIEHQAAGRIARIGQTKPARVVRLIVEDTVESKILDYQKQRTTSSSNTASGRH
ncbi:hypothetical protein CTAYLR_004314 [Chrysophaeum taylorii]|uniref:RING-type domain-containing protein n=1 Tax=Chrysophaeum taylorii TaxID=2483200 RepID=A0AAD7UFP1_9STRA|nr:hypothetical protein CTAYLR_004314 [Chrysophaeum taylorii]